MKNPSKIIFLSLAIVFLFSASYGQEMNKRIITEKELRDKISGYWIGQLTGNHFGFPFELLYADEPVPFDVDRFYSGRDRGDFIVAENDPRGHMDVISKYLDGAPSDDDHDLEFVTLHAMEQYGLDITYEEISPLLASSCNRRIWASTREAIQMIRSGMLPPATGSKTHNDRWGDLMGSVSTEIWGCFYPGMTGKAAEGAEWFARISNDDYAVYLAKMYVAMYSAAFFEDDFEKLLQIGLMQIPKENILHQGVMDIQKWCKEHSEWRKTRQLIFDKYYNKTNACKPIVDALPNGLMGLMALIYAKGDFKKTLTISTSSGLDSDNQPATAGGLVGVMFGEKSLPKDYTMYVNKPEWIRPFNDTYVNISRDGLPVRTPISGIVDRILKIAEQAIIENGGSKKVKANGEVEYLILTDF